MMVWLTKLRKWPKHQKEYVLWGTIILLGLIMLLWWGQRVAERIRMVDRSEIPGLESIKDSDSWREIDQPWSGWSLDQLFPEGMDGLIQETDDLGQIKNNEQNGKSN